MGKEKSKWISVLLVTAVGMLQVASASYAGLERDQIKREIVEEAQMQRVPPSLVLAIAKVGSDFKPYTRGVNGEYGVMQLPDEYGIRIEIEENIKRGIHKISRLMEDYTNMLDVVEAYKRTPGVGQKEMDQYIRQVSRWEKIYREQQVVWGEVDHGREVDQHNEFNNTVIGKLKNRWLYEW